MNDNNKKEKFLLVYIKDKFIWFVLGIFSILVWLKLIGYISNQYLGFILIAFGYGVYFYLTTPFILYWLTYASLVKLTRTNLLITIAVIGIYSYVLWDSYFFFKNALQSWLY